MEPLSALMRQVEHRVHGVTQFVNKQDLHSAQKMQTESVLKMLSFRLRHVRA